MDLGLAGKTALVTGGSRGIGRSIALTLAVEGVHVAICGRNHEDLDATAAQIRENGVQVHAITADLRAAGECERTVEEASRQLGGLDILINNASASVLGAVANLEDMSDDFLMQRIVGKALVAIRCSRAALPHMKRGHGGRIICIGGTAARTTAQAGEVPGSGSSLPYGLGNSMLSNFARHLSNEGAPSGILVNVVHPDVVRTDRHPRRIADAARLRNITPDEIERELISRMPIGRMIEPSDIAALVVFLASQHASAITGQAIVVDGGVGRYVNY